MVKIISTVGDVKTGIQGPAVYQRHYGQQMRRARAPKRAPSSKAQLKHRDLFRYALAWKKTLTTHDRAWLKFHATLAGVIDSYRVPLTWNHYADKIVLTRPRFHISTIGDPPSLVLELYHPALLGVILTREGEGEQKWGNLSSLENEYITTEVHLDVEPEDAIEVKTLPGVIYTYTVPGVKEVEMLFTELWTPLIQASEAGQWVEWDISSLVPLGTKVVNVLCWSVSIQWMGVRKAGSTLDRRIQFGVEGSVMCFLIPTEVSPERAIEVFSQTPMLQNFRLTGYWK